MFDYSYNYNDPGSVPGTLEIEDDAVPSQIVLIDYNEKRAVRLKNLTPEDCSTYLIRDSISWFDVAGLGSKEVLQKLGQIFDLHPLVLEDIVNVPQRPKVENYDNQLLIITQMVLPHQEKQGFWIEQVSFIVAKNYLLTVQEEPDQDCFNAVRERLKHNKGNIRQKGTDYLAYCLWDAIIDGYFPVLEDYGERLEDLEDEVILHPTKETLQKIYSIKRELLTLRRAIWPQRNAIQVLLRDEIPLIGKEIDIHLRDCYDHIVQIIDMVETYRELAGSLMEIYLSSVSNKMNEIMKFLTVMSSIFIPLTFIAGVYGMNFNTEASPWNMPELNWYWGYLFFWVLMLIISGSLIYFFWRRGWFKNTSNLPDDG